MTPRYDSLTSSMLRPCSSSASCIASWVVPAAPLYVIPSAMATLSGEMKMLSPAGSASRIARNSFRPKVLSAAINACSATLSSRGNPVISAGGPTTSSPQPSASQPSNSVRAERDTVPMLFTFPIVLWWWLEAALNARALVSQDNLCAPPTSPGPWTLSA